MTKDQAFEYLDYITDGKYYDLDVDMALASHLSRHSGLEGRGPKLTREEAGSLVSEWRRKKSL